jgi:Protein of unknown function (DUF3551)
MRVWLAVVLTAFLAAPASSAQAAEWCGFLDKEHSQVRCGYSSLTQCKQALGESKDAVCMPSPSFAGKRASARHG